MTEENEKIYKVYKHTLPVSVSGKKNDMVYIGITCKKNIKQRWLNGRGYDYNLHFSNTIKKYGWDNLLHEVLFDGLTKEEAEQKEIELIAFYDSTNPKKGYNLSLGGNSSGKHSETTKQLISQKNKGKIRDEEFKKRLSEVHKGKPKSEEFCQNLSDIHSIAVICIETKEIYKSATFAGKELGIDNSTISKCCRGDNNEAGGFHWMFANEYSEEKAKELLEKTRNNQHRQVMCVDNRKVYDTIQSAALDVGVNISEISACCRGIIMSAGQKRWLYLEDATEEKIQELLSIDISYGKPKSIYCVELDMIFKNAKEAGEYTGVISSNIIAVCKGKKGHKTAGKLPDGTKLHWEYAN